MLFWLQIFLAIYLGITLILALAGNVSKPCRFIARVMISYILLMICATYGTIASAVLRVAGKVSIAQWTVARAFRYTLCPAIGVDFVVENEELLNNVRPAIFISNHQSELDVLALGRLFPQHCSVSAKRSLRLIPFLGWFMALSGTVFIDRANRSNALATFDSAANEITSRKQSVWIFPEGTRSYSTETIMLPFKKGAFHLAIKAQVPIVPVVVQNYSHVLNVKTKTFERGTIKVKVLNHVETKGLTGTKEEVDELVKQVEEDMKRELVNLGLGPKAKGIAYENGINKKEL